MLLVIPIVYSSAKLAVVVVLFLYNLILQTAILFNVLNFIPWISFSKINNLDRKIFTVQLSPIIVLEFDKDTKCHEWKSRNYVFQLFEGKIYLTAMTLDKSKPRYLGQIFGVQDIEVQLWLVSFLSGIRTSLLLLLGGTHFKKSIRLFCRNVFLRFGVYCIWTDISFALCYFSLRKIEVLKCCIIGETSACICSVIWLLISEQKRMWSEPIKQMSTVLLNGWQE